MAQTSCSNCGNAVDDKARFCHICGQRLAEEIITEEPHAFCEECITEIPPDAEACTGDGGSAHEKSENAGETELQKAENASVNLPTVKKFAKKRTVIVIIAIALAILIAVYCCIISPEIREAYSENFEYTEAAISDSFYDVMSAEEHIEAIWYNYSFYEEQDLETYKYTYSNDYALNEALTELFSDSDFASKISAIESDRETISDLMKSLKNPPREYKKAYAAIKEFYGAYLDLTEMVINPKGSLEIYSNNFYIAELKYVNWHCEVQNYIDYDYTD